MQLSKGNGRVRGGESLVKSRGETGEEKEQGVSIVWDFEIEGERRKPD